MQHTSEVLHPMSSRRRGNLYSCICLLRQALCSVMHVRNDVRTNSNAALEFVLNDSGNDASGNALHERGWAGQIY